MREYSTYSRPPQPYRSRLGGRLDGVSIHRDGRSAGFIIKQGCVMVVMTGIVTKTNSDWFVREYSTYSKPPQPFGRAFGRCTAPSS